MQIWMYYNYQLKLPYVTYRVKPNLVGYFPQPGEILANLGPGQFWKKPWSILKKSPVQILINLVKNETSLEK